MMLNSRPYNATPINGVRRLPVRCTGDAAPITLHAELTPRHISTARADSLLSLSAAMCLMSVRAGAGDGVLGATAAFSPSVRRSGCGAARISVGTGLYYTRIKPFSGALLIEVGANAHIGVKFATGVANMHPMTLALDPTRAKTGQGTAVIAASGGMDPMSYRMWQSAVDTALSFLAGLDPTSVSGGVRYITAGMDAPITVTARDTGIKRLSRMGSASTDVSATLFPRSLRDLRGVSVRAVSMHCWGAVQKRATGYPLHMGVDMGLAGGVFVVGRGTATIACGAATATGHVIKRADMPTLGAVSLAVDIAGVVRHGGRGVCTVSSVTPRLDGTRTVVMDGGAAFTHDIEVDAAAIRVGKNDGSALIRFFAAGTGESVVLLESAPMVMSTSLDEDFARLRIPELEPVVVGVSTKESWGVMVRGEGTSLSTLSAGMDPHIVVSMEGQATVWSMKANLHYIKLRPLSGMVPLGVGVEMSGDRMVHIAGDADMGVAADLAGQCTVVLEGDLEMEVLSSAGAYLNIESADTDAQTFTRPPDMRLFSRPAEQRTFMRPDT